MRPVERHARSLLECFQSVQGDDLQRAVALVFVHELSMPGWEGCAPPPGHDWDQIVSSSDEDLPDRLESALQACRRRWPEQIADRPGLFQGVDGSLIRSAIVATEQLTSETQPDHKAFEGRAEILSEVYMATRGSSAQSARGEFYTPMNVATMMSQMVGPAPGEWVIDPTCGAGHLLLAAIDQARCEHGVEAARTITLIGVDLSVSAVEICRMQMILAGAEADQFWIFSGDALRQPVVGRGPDGDLHELNFHLTLSNPPFGKGKAFLSESPDGVIPLVVPDHICNRRIRVSTALSQEMLGRGVVRASEPSGEAREAERSG